jgi:L-alanine-DL-glutamate epimerase-like enolase superfamily enzyme
MKIEWLRVRQVRMPRVDPEWKTASYAASALDACILELGSGDRVGIGAASSHPNSGIPVDAISAQLTGPARDVLVGADVWERTRLIDELRAAGIHRSVVTAVDLALHDLFGKLVGLPCHALWGGAVRSGGAVARFVGIKPPPGVVAAAEDLLEQGFTHFKVKLGTGIEEDVARIQALRSALGPSIWIGIDGNGAYSTDDAIALTRALEPYDVRLIEQPIDYRDLDGLVRLTAASPIPVMADQYVNGLTAAMEICQRRAAHVVSIKIGQAGSIDECRRVAEVCLNSGVRVHFGGGAHPAVVDAAQIHLASSIPGVDEEAEVGEFMAISGDPTSGVIIHDGRYEVSPAPGLGVTLAEG